MDCYLCRKALTPQSNSAEHIIPNAIGGMRKVRGFICRECNGKAGETWDRDLAKQLNKLAVFFRVVRDRGENPCEIVRTTAGERLIYDNSSLRYAYPTIIEEAIGDSTRFQIVANDMKQARQILKGLKRRYPKLDTEKALAGATSRSKYPDGCLQFEFNIGGLSAGKSFVKTALALLSANGVDPRICERASVFLFQDGEPCFGPYYRDDLIVDRPHGVPLHCICVKGDNKAGTVQAYLEYFGIVRIFISLSSDYRGPDFKHSYALDPTAGEELSVAFDINFCEGEVQKIFGYQYYDAQVLSDCFHAVLPRELQRQEERHLAGVLATAKEAMKLRFGGNESIEVDEFIEAYLDSVGPYVRHRAQYRRTIDSDDA